jgi:GxxExxY protein
MKVHSRIGPGLEEELYHQELVARLTASGMEHLSKPRRDLVYRGIVADTFEPDLVVESHFIPELKCLRGSFAPEHLVQLFCYCKFWRLRIGMLVDFGKASLFWKRYAYTSSTARLPLPEIPAFVSSPVIAKTIHELASQALAEIGLGYRETTWRGIVAAALEAGGLNVLRHPTAPVLGSAMVSMPCIVVESTCAVLVTALCDGISATDRAVLQTRLRWLGLPWGLILHFGKSAAGARFVTVGRDGLPTDSEKPTD